MSGALIIEIQCPKFEGLFVGTSHFDPPEYRGFGGSYNLWPGLDVSVILHLIDLGGSPSDLYQYVCVHARTLKAHLHGLSPDLRDNGGKANINERNKEAKSEGQKPPLEMEWRRDGSYWLWLSAEGEFVIAPAEIGGAAYFQLTYEGWTTLEQIGINDCDNPVDELKQRAQRHFARLVEEMRKASHAR